MNQMNNKLCLQQEAYYKYLESEQYQKLPEENEEAEKADKLNDIEDDTENNTDIKIDIKKDLEDTKKHIELTIMNIFKDSPAEEAGLKVNDKIVKAGKIEYKGQELSDFISNIKGEKGSIFKHLKN